MITARVVIERIELIRKAKVQRERIAVAHGTARGVEVAGVQIVVECDSLGLVVVVVTAPRSGRLGHVAPRILERRRLDLAAPFRVALVVAGAYLIGVRGVVRKILVRKGQLIAKGMDRAVDLDLVGAAPSTFFQLSTMLVGVLASSGAVSSAGAARSLFRVSAPRTPLFSKPSTVTVWAFLETSVRASLT